MMNAQLKAKASVSPLKRLHDFEQAPWLDFLSRRFIAEGGLKKLIEQDGLTGVTSNPSIFEKAIGGSADYDSSLQALESHGDHDVMALYEHLAIEDIRHAADALRPVYEAAGRQDGYVSLEVSPYLAMNTDATIAEAQRLWRAVGRDNLMIKVPATRPGLPAIRQLIGEGININITLLFSQQVYEEVVEAYLAGLEHLVAQGGNPGKVASVASFFVSRIDVAIDKLIEERLPKIKDAAQRASLAGLRGKVAIANAKLAYHAYREIFEGGEFDDLAADGARVQRCLWASTSTKNPVYRDVMYAEELIGPKTVNTLPNETIEAFLDHGIVSRTLDVGLDEALAAIRAVEALGIRMETVTDELIDEGVAAFTKSFEDLMGVIDAQRKALAPA